MSETVPFTLLQEHKVNVENPRIMFGEAINHFITIEKRETEF